MHEISLRSDVITGITRGFYSSDVAELEFKRCVFGSESRAPEHTIQALYDLWYKIAAKYSKRNLTYAEDTLVALGGIARAMAELMKRKDPSLDAYYFGGV